MDYLNQNEQICVQKLGFFSFKFIYFMHCVINPNGFDWIQQQHSSRHSFCALKPIIQLLLMGHVLVLDLMCV